MAKLDLDTNEQNIAVMALEAYIKSAQRAQNTARTPQIKEVYAQYEKDLNIVLAKIRTAK